MTEHTPSLSALLREGQGGGKRAQEGNGVPIGGGTTPAPLPTLLRLPLFTPPSKGGTTNRGERGPGGVKPLRKLGQSGKMGWFPSFEAFRALGGVKSGHRNPAKIGWAPTKLSLFDVWYNFFSPILAEKTGISAQNGIPTLKITRSFFLTTLL